MWSSVVDVETAVLRLDSLRDRPLSGERFDVDRLRRASEIIHWCAGRLQAWDQVFAALVTGIDQDDD